MNYQVMPPLTDQEFDALRSSIATSGILVPVEVDENGDLLDGHHRVKAWAELRAAGVDVPDYPRMVRTGFTEEQKRNHARTLNVHRRHLTKEQRDEVMRSMRADGATYQQIADAVGVSVFTAHKAASEVELLENKKLPGADGKYRPASYERKAEPPPTMFIPGYGQTVQQETASKPQQDRQSSPHVSHNSGDNEWYTPAEYIDAAYEVMGEIHLDPASSARANEIVQAAEYYSVERNGLEQPWGGCVWLNPPYAAGLIDKFIDKFASHVRSGDIHQGIVLVNNATDTEWFRTLVAVCDAFVFTRGRVRFWKPDGVLGAPLQGQAILYAGPHKERFLEVFGGFGWGSQL